MKSIIPVAIYFAPIGVGIGLWFLTLVDLGRREMTTGARLAWTLLLLFVPVLGLIVYYLTIVKPGIGVSGEFTPQAGSLLTTKRGKLIAVLGGIGLGSPLGNPGLDRDSNLRPSAHPRIRAS